MDASGLSLATSSVIGVVGGKGGAGASVFAAVLAATAAHRSIGRRAVLVDLDALSGGIDVLLGIESVPGPRWSGLALQGGYLSPAALADALPLWGPVSVLAADRGPTAAAADQLVTTAKRIGPVVLDLGRVSGASRAAALTRCDLVVVLCGTDVVSVAATRVVLSDIARDLVAANVPIALVLKGDGGRRSVAISRTRIGELVGAPVIACLPSDAGLDPCHPMRPTVLPKQIVHVSQGILRGFSTGDEDE